MIKNLIFLFVLIFSVNSIKAKTIIISDIDDTLKNAHVLDNLDLLLFAFKTKNLFKGMPKTFSFLQRELNANIFYVSNAPKNLMGRSHRKFLTRNSFPRGEIFLRDEYSRETHKIKTITNIIKEQNPTRIILIGDNGEHDPKFYNLIKEEYPDIEVITFIRAAYEITHTFDDQEYFTTPFEILFKLIDTDLLNKEKTQDLIAKIGIRFLKETRSRKSGAWFFPSWVNCKGHESILPDTFSNNSLMRTIISNINFRCLN